MFKILFSDLMETKQLTKFKTNFVSEEIPDEKEIDELKKWCAEFLKNKLIKPDDNSLGLSFRSEDEFIITGNKLKENLSNDCFIRVSNYDAYKNSLYVEGILEPPIITLLHYLIYNTRFEVNAIFCGYDESILKHAKELKLVETAEEIPQDALELANTVLDVLGENNFIIIKKYGFLSLGRAMKDAGELALNTLKKAQKLK
jgi:predicted RNA-binding protein